MAKPTPTQDENDRAAMGEHVVEKEADGSPETEASAPPVGAEGEAQMKKRNVEPKPQAPQQGYQTRASTPASPSVPQPPPLKPTGSE